MKHMIAALLVTLASATAASAQSCVVTEHVVYAERFAYFPDKMYFETCHRISIHNNSNETIKFYFKTITGVTYSTGYVGDGATAGPYTLAEAGELTAVTQETESYKCDKKGKADDKGKEICTRTYEDNHYGNGATAELIIGDAPDSY